ncbi:MAG: DUF4430 domain-containing protein [Candidatus Thorarchaeota archaeon]|nr:MAG: DUF4430 domain-containing protein [Candidatus Thorarchaeota archaeon]
MNHREHWLVLVIFSLMIMSIPTNVQAENASDAILAADDISLTIDFGNGTILQFDNLTGSTVLEVTSSTFDIVVEWFGPFAYVRNIEGLVGAGEYGWQYWVNDVFASGAVNLYTLDEGDHVLWRFSAPIPQSQEDPTLLPGAAIVSSAGLGFIIIVYIGTSRRIR